MNPAGRVLGIIAARGGSKGVPRKNLREAGGKPLIGWTIQAAQQSKYITRLILSSDDPEIIAVARSLGCDVPFVRPAHLAQDETPSMQVVLDALERLERVPDYEYVVFLQPTSPLRTTRDIDDCIERCLEARAPSCVSVCEVSEPPEWMYRVNAVGKLSPLLPNCSAATRRQDLDCSYMLNGAVYVARTDWLKSRRTFLADETVAYVMPRHRSLDVDTEEDLEKLRLMMESKIGKA